MTLARGGRDVGSEREPGVSAEVTGLVIMTISGWFLSVWVATRVMVHGGRIARREPHPYEAAYLVGGPRHVIAVALVGLRMDGVLAVDTCGLRVVDAPKLAQTPIDMALVEAIGRRGVRVVDRLTVDPRVRRAVRDLRDGLARDALVAKPTQRRLLTLAMWFYITLLALAIANAIRHTGSDEIGDWGSWVRCAEMAVPAVFMLLVGRGREATMGGRNAVQAMKSRYRHLDPGNRPAQATYGPAAASVSVALFGQPALVTIDEQFTKVLGLGRFVR